jgi:hypothetical protein
MFIFEKRLVGPTDVVVKYHNLENARFVTMTSCIIPRQFKSYFYTQNSRHLLSVPVNEPNSSEIIKANIE